MAELDTLLQSVLTDTEHLKAVFMTNKDGVILAKAVDPGFSDHILELAFSATFTVASDQSGKLGLGRNKMIISTFRDDQLVQFNHLPLLLTFLASVEANTGVLIAHGTDLAEPMRIVAELVARAVHVETKKEFV
ncbi:Ragulator complex protein LAMTOR3 [Fimicolochytrium jonesii]|uniref:Ragulator complex protein LAMTOR3 n=1 Tax=Fimicolochytrium jonesii TaxID=1396493 RepID=UPI0022FDB2DD|nr:Ragulator complex protein LAMTOR3 [Fimicolochytrium jonesii]KAI8818049.1 Ragulator complex protein LAMTOR3 [Fimicolochytrium jonesii]